MSLDEPLLTNASATRFLYGTFALRDGDWVFEGNVVTGIGFEYDRTTGLPIAGEVTGMSLQTRSETAVLEVHITRDCPDHDVSVLNFVYEDCPTDWFDPRVIFAQPAQAPSAPDTPGEDEDNDEQDICLATGDILTRDDLRTVFGVGARKVHRLGRNLIQPDADFWDIDTGAPAPRASA